MNDSVVEEKQPTKASLKTLSIGQLKEGFKVASFSPTVKKDVKKRYIKTFWHGKICSTNFHNLQNY